MKRILMRSCDSPFAVHTPLEVIQNNYIGNNSGNMLFQTSVFRTLFTEDTTIDIMTDYDLKQPEFINENYDVFVLPLANAFRKDFATNQLRALTNIIEKLHIPCIVTGVGLQDSFEPNRHSSHDFDDDVKRFVSAVLNRSATIGVRGEITASYLDDLGFHQHDIIGCPSLYMYGSELPVRAKKTLTKNSIVSITGSIGNPPHIKELLYHCRNLFPNYYYIPQLMHDLKLIYLGIPWPANNPNAQAATFPSTLEYMDFQNDRARFFLNMPSLLEFMQDVDFNIGTRIHGSIGPILAGVPSFIFPTDSRVRELAEYHNLPFMDGRKVTTETDIFDLYEKTDFSQVNHGHKQRFLHYLSFLETNGLDHIYNHGNGEDTPYDRIIANLAVQPPVRSISNASPQEIANRLTAHFTYAATVEAKLKKQYNVELKLQRSRFEKEMEQQAKILEWFRQSSAVRIGASRTYSKLKKLISKE